MVIKIDKKEKISMLKKINYLQKIFKTTKFDKIIEQILYVPNVPVPNVSIFPQVCGICGKIDCNALCKKCELQLRKLEEFRIITNNDEELENKFFDEVMYEFKYEGLIRKLILDYKFNEKSYLYVTFVKFLLKNKKLFENIKKYDTIIPVPISYKRYKERGYNQSLLIAKEIAVNTDLELLNNCLIKTKNIIEQSKLNKEDRAKNISGVYILQKKELIENRKILLVDDIYTTGSTVNECSRMLRYGNPKKIGILILAKD